MGVRLQEIQEKISLRNEVWIVACPEIDDAIQFASTHFFPRLRVIGMGQASPREHLAQERQTFDSACDVLESMASFVVLTTMYSAWPVNFIKRANAAGYRIGLIYVGNDGNSLNRMHADAGELTPTQLLRVFESLTQASRLVDEFLLYQQTKSQISLLGHSLNGLPREVHPMPIWAKWLRLPGLSVTNELQQNAEQARTVVLRKIQEYGEIDAGDSDDEGAARNQPADEVLLFLSGGDGPLSYPVSIVSKALMDLPHACQDIVDWCDRQKSVSDLNQTGQ